MKRSALTRRSPLRRSQPLRTRRRPFVVSGPGRSEWKTPRAGRCECCGQFAWFLHGHHVVYEQIVRREGGDPWTARNRMDLCPSCHLNHHGASRKIPLSRVPSEAVAFAVDLLGEHRAAEFFRRRYEA